MSTSDPKVYDNMSKEERAEHDAKQREREKAEQAGGSAALDNG